MTSCSDFCHTKKETSISHNCWHLSWHVVKFSWCFWNCRDVFFHPLSGDPFLTFAELGVVTRILRKLPLKASHTPHVSHGGPAFYFCNYKQSQTNTQSSFAAQRISRESMWRAAPCFPKPRFSAPESVAIASLESLENGPFWKDPVPKRSLLLIPVCTVPPDNRSLQNESPRVKLLWRGHSERILWHQNLGERWSFSSNDTWKVNFLHTTIIVLENLLASNVITNVLDVR